MTDYLAIALAQWEEVSAIMAEELATPIPPEGAEGTPGGHLFRMEKTPPRPPEKMPEGGFRFPPSGHPLETTKGRELRFPPFGNPPGAVLLQRVSGGGSLRNATAALDQMPHFVAGTGHGGDEPEDFGGPAAPKDFGGPAADLAKLNTAGASRSAAVFDGLLPGSGSGADGAILTSLISRKQKGQKGFLGGSGGPFFGLSKNGPPGETALPLEGKFSPALGWRLPSAGDASAREETVLPLLRQLRQAQWGAGFVQGQRRQLAVTLPEATSTAPSLSAEDFDLTCERDARRYGGGFALY